MFTSERQILLSTLKGSDQKLLQNTNRTLNKITVFGHACFDKAFSTQILNATIEYILLTKKFEDSLFSSVVIF